MRCIKIKSIFLTVFCLLSVISIFTGIVKADAKIEFDGEPTYYCYKTTNTGYYYLINFTLCNNGNEESVPINVGTKELIGEDYKNIYPEEYQDLTFSPGECKSFSIDWPTINTYDEIEIVYDTVDLADQTYLNSDSKSITIEYKESDSNSTPGFELILLIVALLLVFIKKRLY